MTSGPSERPRLIRRYARRHPVKALLLIAACLGMVALTVALASRFISVTSIEIVLLALGPPLLLGTAFSVRRVVRASRRRIWRWRELRRRPTNRPIEQIAADLRRMLWRHDAVARSTDIPRAAGQLRALEAGISKYAVQAARALEVSHPVPPPYSGLETCQLRRLLHALRAEGFALPLDVGLMAPDNRF